MKRCLFCKNTDVTHRALDKNKYVVWCNNEKCGARGPVGDTKLSAEIKWNNQNSDQIDPKEVILMLSSLHTSITNTLNDLNHRYNGEG